MTLEVTRRSDEAVALAGEVTVHDAAALRDGLLPLLDVGEPITIDLSEVRELDLAGLQVLVALVRHRGRDRVVFAGCPEELRRRVQLVGLSDWLAL